MRWPTEAILLTPDTDDAKCITLRSDACHRSALPPCNKLILQTARVRFRQPRGLTCEPKRSAAHNDCNNEVGMKKVIFAVLLTALALFLIVPNLSWAF